MKKLSFKAFISFMLVFVLAFSVIYMPGMSFGTMAADCSDGHSFTATNTSEAYLKSEATCKGSGQQAVYYYSCATCGISSKGISNKTFKSGAVPSHSWGAWVNVAATCTKGSYQKRTCNNCGENYIKNVQDDALEHIIEIRNTGAGTHLTLCKRSGCGYSEKADCSSKTLVCGVVPVCDVCETAFGTATDHDLTVITVTKNPTCTEDGEKVSKCSRCDYSKTETLSATGHDYKLASVVKEATCDKDGTEKHKCSACGDEIEKTIPAFGHSFEKTVVPPTCKENGYDKHVCSVCKYSYKDNENTNLAHDFVETRKEATCEADGLVTYKCRTCDETKDDLVLPKLGHDMSGFVVTKKPTCTDAGVETDKCSRCSLTTTKSVPATGHTLEDKVTAPTCTAEGYTVSKCKDCSYSETGKKVAALGHNWITTGKVEATCTLEGFDDNKCQRCGITERKKTEPLGHTFNYVSDGNATCTTDGTKSATCIRCPEKSTVADVGSKLPHKYTKYYSNDNADCTKNATEYAICDLGCGSKDVREVANTALGHDLKTLEGKAATCTSTGLTEGKKCDRCKEIVVPQELIPVKPHNYEIEVVTQPTCSTAGSANYKCKDCSHAYTGEVAATGNHKWDNGTVTSPVSCEEDGEKTYKCGTCNETKTEKLNRLGHSYATEFTVDLQATCYREGEKSKHCTREGCQAKIETTSIPVTDHDLGEYESNGDATCENDGTKSRKCKVCTYKTSPIQDAGTKLGHSFTNYVSDGNTTCLVDGTKTAHCDNGCGMKNTEVEKATGHEVVIDEAKEATCTEEGLTEGKHCKKCSFVIVAQEIIDAKNHNEAIKPEKEPTCTKTGLTQGIYCITCEEDIIPQETIPKLGHDYEKTVTKATTSADGKIDYKCNRCGYEKTGKIYKVTSIKLASTTYYYNGETQAPEKAVVKDSDGKTLTAGTDYEIDYSASTISAKVGKYKVKIVLKGNYEGSKTLSFKIVPGKISKVKTEKTTTSIKLKWSKSEGATGYRVYRYDTSKKKWVTVKKSTTDRSYTIKNLTSGKTYLFSVKPYYKKGDTVIWGQSKRWETATLPQTPNVTLKSNAAKAVTVSWDKVSGATGYVVYYSTEKNGTYKKVKSTTGTSVTVNNLTAGKGVYFKVRAYRKTSNGNVYSASSAAKRIVPRAF